MQQHQEQAGRRPEPTIVRDLCANAFGPQERMNVVPERKINCMDLRSTAREIFLDALDRVDLRRALPQRLHSAGTSLHIGQTAYDLAQFHDVRLVALGKAALPMADALLAALAPLLTTAHTLRGIVVGTSLPGTPHPDVSYRIGAHPILDPTSLEAAQDVLNLLARTTPQTLVFFLISGGASAMVDVPLDPTVSLADLAMFNRTLVHAGLSIADMNTLRKHVSAIKGGRLAVAAAPAPQCTLLVSDVPPAQPDIVASGLTLPDPSTLADCRRLLAASLAQAPIPASIRGLLEGSQTPETPKSSHPAFARATAHTLLSSDDLALAAQAAAAARGIHAVIDLTPDDWPFAKAAAYLLGRLKALTRENPTRTVCVISAGELAVPVPTSSPGLGGRNQHFALHCALLCAGGLAGAAQPTAVLSAGSDGMDGNSPAAGAVVDETTSARAARLGLDPQQALAGFNSYPLLHTLGDTVITGPTGNNLRDLRLLLVAPADRRQDAPDETASTARTPNS